MRVSIVLVQDKFRCAPAAVGHKGDLCIDSLQEILVVTLRK